MLLFSLMWQLFLFALCTPMNMLYRSSRIVFLRSLQRVFCAPFYKVGPTLNHSFGVE
jgi:hypothetical protein